MELGIDLKNFEKPVLAKKPVKPKKPALTKKTKMVEKSFWQTSATDKEFKLLEVLKHIPKSVDLEDVKFWITPKKAGNYWDAATVSNFNIGSRNEVPDSKYLAAMEKYEAASKKYNEDLANWEKAKTDYDKKMEVYAKYKDLIDVQSEKQALSKKLGSLASKLDGKNKEK